MIGTLFTDNEGKVSIKEKGDRNKLVSIGNKIGKPFIVLVNLLGHDCNIQIKDNIFCVEKQDISLRCIPERKTIMTISGIKIIKRSFELNNKIPEVISNVYYIVSYKTLMKIQGRDDMIVPLPIRKLGKVVACSGFFNIT